MEPEKKRVKTLEELVKEETASAAADDSRKHDEEERAGDCEWD